MALLQSEATADRHQQALALMWGLLARDGGRGQDLEKMLFCMQPLLGEPIAQEAPVNLSSAPASAGVL
jgi:hypothetical protein